VQREIRLVIADDHPLFRHGLRGVLERAAGLTLAGEASNGEEALSLIRDLKPDVAVLDIDMPGLGGLDVVRRLNEEDAGTETVFLTMYSDEEMFTGAMDLGVRGYVVKESAVRDIIECVRTVASGGYYISPSLAAYLVRHRERSTDLRRANPGIDRLTPAERRVLRLVAEGYTTKAIAVELNLSPKTVDNQRQSIAAKLELQGTYSLLKFAVQHRDAL
jgi:DNA-binding NarL/FixJ family response regulator